MHRQHRPALRRAPPRRLPVPNVQRPVGAELRRLRVAMQIRDIEHHRLAAAQPPRVDDLEQRRVAERRQRPLPTAPRDAIDLVIRMVEEPLQLRRSSTPAGPGGPRTRSRAPPCSTHGRSPPAPGRTAARTPQPTRTGDRTQTPRTSRAARDTRGSSSATGPSDRSDVVNASTSCARQVHGYSFVNSANRRTSRSRWRIVSSFSILLRCCAHHPASIPSNTARAGSS